MSPNRKILIFICVISIVSSSAAEPPPLSTVAHYETLHYNTQDVHRDHLRYRRSIDSDDDDNTSALQIEFTALGRKFNLDLVADTEAIHRGLTVMKSDGTTIYAHQIELFYHGSDQNDPGSFVRGAIVDGRFMGKISSLNDTQIKVEPIEIHFQPDEQPALAFHSIIYREEHIIHSDIDIENGLVNYSNDGECVDDDDQCRDDMMYDSSGPDYPDGISHHQDEPEIFDHDKHSQAKHRQKRRIERPAPDMWYNVRGGRIVDYNLPFTMEELSEYKYCQVQFVLEPRLVKHLANNNILLVLVVDLFDYINTMVISQEWDYGLAGMSLVLSNIRLIEEYEDPTNPITSKSLGKFLKTPDQVRVPNTLLLKAMTRSYRPLNQQDYCLNGMLAFRESGRAVGRAWIGGRYNSAGGVGGKQSQFIVTAMNRGKMMNTETMHLSVAHEVGHVLGANHPMFDVVNHPKNVDPVDVRFDDNQFERLQWTLKTRKYFYFDRTLSLCGNTKVDEGEQCDCGSTSTCASLDAGGCCNPAGTPNECQYSNGSQCTPTEGPCCSSDCTLVTALDNVECALGTGCSDPPQCDGTSVTCPESGFVMPDFSRCEWGYCMDGECTYGSCADKGLTECDYDVSLVRRRRSRSTYQCLLSCVYNGMCQTTRQLSQFGKVLYRRPPFSLCNSGRGYCDSAHKCHRGVAEFDTMVEEVEDPEELYSEWLEDNVWIYLLVVVGLVVMSIVLFFVVGSFVRSSNPWFISDIDMISCLTCDPCKQQRGESHHVTLSDEKEAGNLRYQLFEMFGPFSAFFQQNFNSNY